MNSKSVKSTIVVLVITILCSCSSPKKIEIVDLNCEYVENPLGIDVIKPRLSWKLKTEQNSTSQYAYKILVSSNIKLLKENTGDLWDSDIVHSSQSNQIVYDGSKLKSRQKVFWKVKVWDQNNVATWSEIAAWEMALIEESDWQAKWIGTEEKDESKVGQQNPALYYRKSFNVTGDVKNARAYISGLGYYELYINGEKVGDHVLAPNQTNYDFRQTKSYENGKIANMSTRVLYETHDLSSYLNDGENVASVILGNGWYYQNEKSEYLPLYYDTPRFIAQIEIQNTNNKTDYRKR